MAARAAVADPVGRHAPADRRVRRRHADPRRRGPGRPRPDHHAHVGARRAAEGPGPAGRRGRLPDQAVPPGRAARPHEEPHRALRAERLACRAPADGAHPRLLRGQGRRRDHDDRDQRGDRAPDPRPARVPRGRQPPVRGPPRVPRPRARPQEHRRRGQRPGDGQRPHPQGRPDPRFGDRPAARAAVARVRRPRDTRPHAPGARAAARDVRLHHGRHRQAPRRRQPRWSSTSPRRSTRS